MILFLRQLGCIFCQETLSDLSIKRPWIEKRGLQLLLVHMASNERAGSVFKEYQLDDVPRVSDADRKLYNYFELKRGNLSQLMGFNVWLRGIKAFSAGHTFRPQESDPKQLAGAFLIEEMKIRGAFRHASACDQLDLEHFICQVGDATTNQHLRKKI